MAEGCSRRSSLGVWVVGRDSVINLEVAGTQCVPIPLGQGITVPSMVLGKGRDPKGYCWHSPGLCMPHSLKCRWVASTHTGLSLPIY